MAEPATSESSPDTDRDFDPSADMMVHDYDDERTLDEEEGLSGESVHSELDALEKEGDMPIEQLLAMYGYAGEMQDTRSSSEEEILSNQDLTLDKEEIARDLLMDNDEHDRETSVNDLLDSVQMPSNTVRLLRSTSQANSSDEESDDIDYEPEKDDWKKTIQVGSDYQAVVPEGLCKYGDAPAYENEDRFLWDPHKVQDNKVESYLREVQNQNLTASQGVHSVPAGAHVRDDEQALYLLLQCGHNVEEALRRRKMQAVPRTDPMSLWSEEECRNFEMGLRTYGKDFHLIQQNKVRTRSVGELVQFYYLWKKTERHDVFANKTRLEKRKYALHPGITDYVDRFLDDQEAPAVPRDRSTSPSINSLLYGDHKRQPLRPPSRDGVSSAAHSATQSFSPVKLSQHDLNFITASPTPLVAATTTTTTTTHVNNNNNNTETILANSVMSGHSEPHYGQAIHEHSIHIANFTSDLVNSDDCLAQPIAKKFKPDTDKNCINNDAALDMLTSSATSSLLSDVESNHVSGVALSIGSVNSIHTVSESNINAVTSSETTAITTAEPVAQ